MKFLIFSCSIGAGICRVDILNGDDGRGYPLRALPTDEVCEVVGDGGVLETPIRNYQIIIITVQERRGPRSGEIAGVGPDLGRVFDEPGYMSSVRLRTPEEPPIEGPEGSRLHLHVEGAEVVGVLRLEECTCSDKE